MEPCILGTAVDLQLPPDPGVFKVLCTASLFRDPADSETETKLHTVVNKYVNIAEVRTLHEKYHWGRVQGKDWIFLCGPCGANCVPVEGDDLAGWEPTDSDFGVNRPPRVECCDAGSHCCYFNPKDERPVAYDRGWGCGRGHCPAANWAHPLGVVFGVFQWGCILAILTVIIVATKKANS
eukprot:TRINITY_DN59598_c0_g1_i1.p1 TRINITY_DN59598_c0_g1~~TRINITY_DN59598_c0_g1_i1.p1  ORF type:complete len:180 (-),score=14.45 TRINITY_DN59598_c0_g1_i1:4-543(-)